MATPDDWSQVGYNGNPVTGNPEVVDGIAKGFRHLEDLAAEAARGLDAFLLKAEDGGFEGETADGLREYIRRELRTTFVPNVQRSFEQAASATERYANALRDAQGRAEGAARRGGAVAIPPAGIVGKNAPPPAELTAAKNDVRAEVDFITAEAKILEDALDEAADLVSKPVPKTKKTAWQKFWQALEIITMVVSIIAIFVAGPIGLLAMALNAAVFLKAVADYAAGKTNALGLGLAFLGLLGPSTKGLTTFGRLAGLLKTAGALGLKGALAALRGAPRALSAGGRLLLRNGKLLFHPRTLATLTGQFLTRGASRFGGLASTGLSRISGFMARAPRILSGALRSIPGFFRGMWQQGRFAIRRDFFMSTAFVSGSTGRRLGVYAIINTGRAFDLAVSALLPVRYGELARFGYRTAFRMGFLERGLLMRPSVGRSITRGAGSVGNGLFDLTRKGLHTPDTGRTGGDFGKLVTPGTQAWDDALDELTEFVPPPAALPRTPAVSSLSRGPGSTPNQFSSSLDDLVEPTVISDLDTAGSRFSTLLGKQGVDVLDLDRGGQLPPPLLRTLDTLDTLDELGRPSVPGPRSVLLEQPPNAVTRLRNLDTVMGLDRTGAGLLKPLDDLEDLANLGLDGDFGGLTVTQLSKILDGEIDLVNVTPDGVVLRIGKTDPVDVQVRLTGEVTVRVLNPSETVSRLPSVVGKFTGPDAPAGPGIKLDDLVRLLPDAGGDTRRARQLLGLGPLRTDLVTTPVTTQTGFPPLTLREIITGGEVGKTATDRFQAWLRVQNAEIDLDTAGRELSRLTELPDVPPLNRAQAELDLSAAELKFNQARMDFDRLGLNLDTVRQDITVMMTRFDGPAAGLPTGELRLLDDVGQPTGQWITLEPGASVQWVLRTDAGVVPRTDVRWASDGFVVTTPEGVFKVGPEGRPVPLDTPAVLTGRGPVNLPSPGSLDRLFAAADRSVDIRTIRPEPVWREGNETLWRIGGKRGLDQIFSEGFRPRAPLETNLDVMVRTGDPSAFVSTTTDSNLIWDGVFKFEIEAPGGIDVGRTFERAQGTEAWKASGWESQREIAFPGGIAPEFIRGAYRLDAQHNLVDWVPNPNFKGSNPLPDLAADLRLSAEGTSGLNALDFQGLSVDDQLRLLDQLDLGGSQGLNRVDSLGDLDLGKLSDSFDLNRYDGPFPESELRLLDPGHSTGLRLEWESMPRAGGGATVTNALGDVRLQYTAGGALEFVEVRVPGRGAFLQFDAVPDMRSVPKVVGPDGTPSAAGDVVINPVRGALGVATGVEVRTLDGLWTARFDLDGTRLSERLTLSGVNGGPLAGGRLTTTFTQVPGGGAAPSFRLTVPGPGDGTFSVRSLDGELAQRLPGGFQVTDTRTGASFVLDRGGRFVDLPAEGAPSPSRLDTSGATVPDTNVVARMGPIDFGGTPTERFPLTSNPEENLLDIAATDLTRTLDRAGAVDTPVTDVRLPGLDERAFQRLADTGPPTDLTITRLTPFDGVPLSGTGDLAGRELRLVAASPEGTPGSFGLEVVEFSPTRGGAGPEPRFTVERIESGGFRVTDPAGTTRWEFSAGGGFVARETALVDNDLGLPPDLWFRVTNPSVTADGTSTRFVGVVPPGGRPASLTDSFRLTLVDRTLRSELPGGFTLTDTVSGGRFHFDADGNLMFRDRPAHDGSGLWRFTEGAPDTPPVRLDDLGAPGDGLGPLADDVLDDLTENFHRTLDDASGGTRLPDAPDLSLSRDLRMPHGTGDRSGLPLIRFGSDDLPELDDPRIWAALDEHWRTVLDAAPGTRLTGMDELADFDIRTVRVPSTDTAPGSFRLELVNRTPEADGTIRGADFTVERAPDGGYVVTDPTRTTTWTFAEDGRFLGRETILSGDGLPADLQLRVTVVTDGDGTARTVVDLTGPSGSVNSVRLTPVTGTLAERLPGGFTLTDTVTGSRFHFDNTGRLAYRDLPARDGSGFDRFAEGVPGTPPTRLVEPLAERFPLTSIPEEDLVDEAVLDDVLREGLRPEEITELAPIFERTLDEASGFRIPPSGTAADLSDITGATDFLHAADDAQAFQTLDLPRLQQLADGASDSLNRFGLSPDLLHGDLRGMTGQAQLTLRREAASALGDYLALPPEIRVRDIDAFARGEGGRTVGDFTVSVVPRGGPGGSRYVLVHNPTGLTHGYGFNRELLYQEMFVRGGPAELDGMRVGLTGRAAGGGEWTPSSMEFVGSRPGDLSLTVTPLVPDGLPRELRGGFTVTDASGAVKWHYGPEGRVALRDVGLPADRGGLRFDMGAPDGVPQALDRAGLPSTALRVERLDDGRIAAFPTGPAAHRLERAVFDTHGGTLLEETIAVRGKGGRFTGEFWNIDHVAGKAVRTDADGTPFTDAFSTATVERPGTGQFRLTSTTQGKVPLFEREVLRNGNTLHVDWRPSGRARWTEFDAVGSRFRHGQRVGDVDQRTFHDVTTGTWRVLNTMDVRTYTKAIDGGLVRAEKGADGHWTWQRFDKSGTEVLSGDRHWSWNHVAFQDTYRDPVTGLETVAQQRGQTWPFGGVVHGSRTYSEHAVMPGLAPAGGRVDPGDVTGFSPLNVQVERLETLADGGSLFVRRFADMRPPAFMWKGAAGRNPFDGFFSDLFAGESLGRVSFWTETAADGTEVTGVRLNPTGANWVDFDQYGRLVRESRKLENGQVIEVGRGLEDPAKWAPVPEFRSGGSYELHWKNTTTGQTGTRHVDGNGRWRDIFTDDQGIERVQLRSEGRGTREYLHNAPSTEELRLNDDTGFWVDKNTQQHISGRRDLVDDKIVESSGSPYRTKWTWKAYDPSAPETVIGEGIRRQNRGSIYTHPWDDSFKDFDLDGNLVRERNATDTGSSWIDAVKQDDGTWKWTRRGADGTVKPGDTGVRVYDDIKAGRWRDLIDDQVVRQRVDDRVREFKYEIVAPEPPAAPTAPLRRGSLRDLLSDAARHFETPATVRVDRDVWKEFDAGKVFRERIAVDGVPGRHRVIDKQWGQWVEFQNGHLVQRRTPDGRIWTTDAFGRWGTSGPATVFQRMTGTLPRVGGDVGLHGSRGWTQIGREFDWRGLDAEIMGHMREIQDVWHGTFTRVKDGEALEMPMWQRELRSGLLSFSTTFVTDFGASLAITAAVNDGQLTRDDYLKALITGGVGGTFTNGLNLLYNHTRLGWLKTSIGTRDWGGHPNQTLATQTDDWVTEFAAQEKVTRWRNATYANTVGLGTSALSAFVSNSVNAAIFGVNGNETKGWDALEAGGWGALASAFGGVTTNLAKNVWHLTAGGRVFHKGGWGEYAANLGESALSRYFTWVLNERDDNDGRFDLPNAGRSFPTQAPTTPPVAPPSQQQNQQPAPDAPAAFTADDLELP
ncbi:hypothetical protein ACFS5L_41180 [Streptomyces phyllanthi]|uniref:Pierisin-like domain-containing protein n=1 Tax=Streptomyces phyllanthi TaxID=1803180 RepID=A0A5N8VVX4_9ACTN|nr:hypothetical protein [Streptomyces phyllanthi]MPY39407.1 hypothetical protein [Streptomyces phyllanthi]